MHAAPLMLGDRAIEKLMNRKTKVASYQNDLTLIGDYWGWYDKRFYHHTGMVSMTYAMREALEVVKVGPHTFSPVLTDLRDGAVVPFTCLSMLLLFQTIANAGVHSLVRFRLSEGLSLIHI